MLAQLVSSCATTGKPTQPSQSASLSTQAALAEEWTKVHNNPPTWYPRGVSPDIETDHASGDWIYTEDAQGTRFFLPRHGIQSDRRKKLLADALAARSPEKKERIAHEEAVNSVGKWTLGAVGNLFLGLGSGL